MRKFCDFFTNPAHLGLLLAFASAAALAFAYTMQYGFNHLPCHLCYEQRKPYMLAIVFGLLAYVAAKTKTRLAFPFLLLTGVCFLIDMGIAGFHFGTEQKWWPLAAGCGGEGAIPDPNLSMAELMKYFENRPIVRCDVPGWIFLGISMTGWNFLYASALAVFTFFHAIRGRSYGKKA